MNPTSKRRRFQPPITTYFPTSIASDSSPDALRSHPPNKEPVSFPPLPHHIQSSLLTVGMRIRKSVPEGYKTSLISKISSFFLDSGSAGADNSRAYNAGHSSGSTTGFAELAPYCGIMKTGNLGVQAFAPNPSITEDPYSLSSSQESAISMDSMPAAAPFPITNPHKRAFDDSDEDDQEESDIPPSIWDDCASSPPQQPDPSRKGHHRRGSSYPFSHTRMPNLNTLVAMANPTCGMLSSPPTSSYSRPFAQPKTRLKRPDNLGQENMIDMGMTGGTEVVDDFDEAAFLRRREDVEMDG